MKILSYTYESISSTYNLHRKLRHKRPLYTPLFLFIIRRDRICRIWIQQRGSNRHAATSSSHQCTNEGELRGDCRNVMQLLQRGTGTKVEGHVLFCKLFSIKYEKLTTMTMCVCVFVYLLRSVHCYQWSRVLIVPSGLSCPFTDC